MDDREFFEEEKSGMSFISDSLIKNYIYTVYMLVDCRKLILNAINSSNYEKSKIFRAACISRLKFFDSPI